jgi:hypothetical protein
LAQRATALGLNVSATQAQQQGMENYEQELSNLYGMDIGAQNANRQLNQQSSRDTVNGVQVPFRHSEASPPRLTAG